MDQGPEIDVSKLTQRDREELQQFIVNETQKSKIQQCTCTSLRSSLHRKRDLQSRSSPRDAGGALNLGNCPPVAARRRGRGCGLCRERGPS